MERERERKVDHRKVKEPEGGGNFRWFLSRVIPEGRSSRILPSLRVREVTNVFRQGRLTMSADIGRQRARAHARASLIRPRGGEGQEVLSASSRAGTPTSFSSV